MPIVRSLSLSARITMDLHSLNNEGTEGNQQQTRMVHVIDQHGQRAVVNAVSGDMLKHMLVGHMTPLLSDQGQPLSNHAREHHPDRILPEPQFREFVKNNKAGNSAILGYMLKNCAVTDIAGALFAEKAVARKSCVEFGWVVGLPDRTVTEQYFHVKYDPQSREKSAGGASVEGTQAIFHRPASSGVYALVCGLEVERIGLNDITRKYEVALDDRKKRARAAVYALAATLLKPTGAQRNTQSPHIVACEGMVSTSSGHFPAPMMSPLSDAYQDEITGVAKTLNEIGIAKGTVQVHPFATLAQATKVLADIAAELDLPQEV